MANDEVPPPPQPPLPPQPQQPPQPPQPENEYPELTINPLPSTDPSTLALRHAVELKIRQARDFPEEADLSIADLRRLLKLYEEMISVDSHIASFANVTVTNFSEYFVLNSAPSDIKVWVDPNTSPTSVDAIKRYRTDIGCRMRILFASELTAEQLAGDVNELFDELNPEYSSSSSEIVEADDDDDFGYSDPELQEVAAEAAELEKKRKG